MEKKRVFFSFVVLFLLTTCVRTNSGSQGEDQTPAEAPASESASNDGMQIEVKTFQNEDGSWGYDIFLDGRRYIHQPEMPAVAGRNGFDREAQALRVGEMVVIKIRRGIMPPSVSAAELNDALRE